MDLDFLNNKIVSLEKEINVARGERSILQAQLDKTQSEIQSLEEYENILSKVIILFQKTSDYGRRQAKTQIENLVTKCLQYILESDIEFTIEISESRDIPQAEFYVISNYDGYSIKTKPELARGGGIVDIISIALRIAFMQIHRPEIQGPLILDEPGKHVSDDYIFNLGELLKKSSNMFKRQIIMVTHDKHLSEICDLSYFVTNKAGISIVEKSNEY
ncbi:ATPase [Peptoniphilus catoniae]|uniref:ATPase n=1 Tax=Peptoniphilus catoniae TaxID=1660341 RepID=UPI0010FF526F|nr:ATPase [Peptoniphilus catoniae]